MRDSAQKSSATWTRAIRIGGGFGRAAVVGLGFSRRRWAQVVSRRGCRSPGAHRPGVNLSTHPAPIVVRAPPWTRLPRQVAELSDAYRLKLGDQDVIGAYLFEVTRKGDAKERA